MTDPRIRYDILANAEGEDDVARLAAELEKLDGAIDPQAAAKAKALAEELRLLADKRASVEAFLRALADTDTAARALEQAQESARKFGQALEGVERPTRAQSGQLEKLRDATERAQRAYTEKTAVLSTARGALDRLGVGTTELGAKQQLLTEALARTKAQATQLAAGYQATATAAAASAAAQVRAQSDVKSGLDGLNDTYRRLQSVAALAIGGGVFTNLIGDVATTADAYKNLESRIKLVTGEGPAFDRAFQGVADIALRTNTSLETTGTLFSRIAAAGKDIGLTQTAALALTETINQTLALSGATAASSDAAITQLIQGLQSGVLRGEEFNSVVEQSPRLAQALADGLGVARGELRALANDGRLTSEVVISALQGQANAVQKEFATLPLTVGRAIQSLSNSWTLYIGEVDKAGGASQQAAEFIKALADNLDTVATVLFSVGKAAAAYKALQLAQTFLGIGEAAKLAAVAKTADVAATVASTAATTVNTVATTANTTAKVANAAASKAGALAWGTLADGIRIGGTEAAKTATVLQRAGSLAGSALGALRGAVGGPLALVAILANYREIGTAIGEGAAKLFGFGKQLEENERQLAADAEASRLAGAARAELAAKTKAAEEAAFGFTAQSKKLVGEFEEVRTKTGSVEEALEKVSKSLQLDNVQGIRDAGTALDALATKGEVSAQAISASLARALDGQDLLKFEVLARTAFDGSTRGAERLALTLEAVLGQALRRTGVDVSELTTGISKGASDAINNFDLLARSVEQLKSRGVDTGRALSASLDKALEAASTEKAVQQVIERWEQLGRQGVLTGDKLADGLTAARKKLDDLKTGINSLDEALRVFGLKTKSEMDKVAGTFREAYDTIRNDATVSFEQKQTAFKAYADAAIAANGGIASSELKLKAEAVQLRIELDETGRTVVRTMAESEQAIERTASRFPSIGTGARRAGDDVKTLSLSFGQLGVAAEAAGAKARKAVQDATVPSLGSAAPGAIDIRDPDFLAKRNASIGPTGSLGDRFRATPKGGITRTEGGQIPPPPGDPSDYVFNTNRRGEGPYGLGVWELTPEAAARQDELIRNPDGRAGAPAPAPMVASGGATRGQVAAPTSAASAPVTINVAIGRNVYDIRATDQSSADSLLKALESAYRAGGGG